MNKVIQIGRICTELSLKFLPGSGTATTNFSIAVDRQYQKDKTNKITDFHRIQVWGKLAEICANNLGKGRLVAVEGELQNNNYEDKSGVKHYGYQIKADNVQFLDFKKQEGSTENPAGFAEVEDDDDSIPF